MTMIFNQANLINPENQGSDILQILKF